MCLFAAQDRSAGPLINPFISRASPATNTNKRDKWICLDDAYSPTLLRILVVVEKRIFHKVWLCLELCDRAILLTIWLCNFILRIARLVAGESLTLRKVIVFSWISYIQSFRNSTYIILKKRDKKIEKMKSANTCFCAFIAPFCVKIQNVV